jgi:hypothetical protein
MDVGNNGQPRDTALQKQKSAEDDANACEKRSLGDDLVYMLLVRAAIAAGGEFKVNVRE